MQNIAPPTGPKNHITEGFFDIRKQIEELEMPHAAFAAVGITEKEYFVAIVDGEESVVVKIKSKNGNTHDEVIHAMQKHAKRNEAKIIAASIIGDHQADILGSRLWLELDIVPYVILEDSTISEVRVQEEAYRAAEKFDTNDLVIVPVSDTNEVGIANLTTLDEYEHTVSASAWKTFQSHAKAFEEANNNLLFINATPQGGGVALMRHATMRLFREMGMDAHWHVLIPNKDVFSVTKTKFHNVLQAVAPPDVELTEEDTKLYESWIHENASHLAGPIKRARTIVIDDPQPAGLIPHIKQANPGARIIFRSHIHLDNKLLAQKGSPQHTTWKFLSSFIDQADLYVSHPVESFIPEDVLDKAVTMPATTDPLDGLNKELNEEQINYYMKLFDKVLLEHDQTRLDPDRPFITQIARFDPSKGIPDVIESFRLLRESLPDTVPAPQLVLAGHGSIDDPDGLPMYNMTCHLAAQKPYNHLTQDIKIVRLHHNDQILNALLRASHAALQLSHKEGFEVKVTEAIQKGKPVIAYKAGGIPLQIQDGKSGFLVDVGDCKTVAQHLKTLFVDQDVYDSMSRHATDTLNPNYFTVYNCLKWLYVSNALAAGTKLPGNGTSVATLAGV